MYVNGHWVIEFRRQLNGVLSEDWAQLQELLSYISLSEGRDKVSWVLEQSRKNSTSSLYKLMTSGGIRDLQMLTAWKCNIPLKVKILCGWLPMTESNQEIN